MPTESIAVAPAPPPAETEQLGRLAGMAIAVVVFAAGILRFLLRPLLDVLVYESWKRKANDVALDVRAMVQPDIATLAASVERLAETVERSAAVQQAYAHDQAGYPLLAVSVELMADNLGKLAQAQEHTNAFVSMALSRTQVDYPHGGATYEAPAGRELPFVRHPKPDDEGKAG